MLGLVAVGRGGKLGAAWRLACLTAMVAIGTGSAMVVAMEAGAAAIEAWMAAKVRDEAGSCCLLFACCLCLSSPSLAVSSHLRPHLITHIGKELNS